MMQLGIILGCLLFFYVASIGPVVAWIQTKRDAHNPDAEGETLRVVYFPIIAVCDCSEPVSECFEAYGQYFVKLSRVKNKQGL